MRSYRNPQGRPLPWHGSLVARRSLLVALAATEMARPKRHLSPRLVLIVGILLSASHLAPSRAHAQTPQDLMVLTGEAVGDRFGVSARAAGDVNGDGYDDVIVGAVAAGGDHAGRAYIYYGGSGADALPDVVLTGEAPGDQFGNSVSGAGDVNGDGYADVIVGAYLWSNTGRAYVYYGGPGIDALPDLVLTGPSGGGEFAIRVGAAGDVNGDGYADVIVGAINLSRAYVYYGGPAPDATADMTLIGEVASDDLGISVAMAGDVNGDGYSDVIVGAFHNDAGGADAGRAYVYYGGATADNTADLILTGFAAGQDFGYSVGGAGDVNGDGYGDVIVGGLSGTGNAYLYYGGPGADAVPDLTLTGAASSDLFGYSVSTAGDVNKDGFADVIVGAIQNDAGGTDAGRAYIYYGGAAPNAVADITLTGAAANDYYGISVGTAGDVDGDGIDDVIVGAYLNDAGGTDAGRAYVTAIHAPPLPPSPFVRENAWAPNGAVNAIVSSGNTLYIGGKFSLVGPASGPAVAIDYLTAAAQKPFPRVTGKVRAVEPDGSGGWYIGGAFTTVEGQMRNNLAHIDASGNLTPWNPDVNGEVDDIAVGTGVVYVGGVFSFVGPTPRSYVAAIDGTTGMAVTTWISSPNGSVTELEWAGSEIYIGGAFTAVNGAPHEHLAALSASTGTPTSFNSGTGTGVTNIDALEFSGGKLLLGITSNLGYSLKTYDVASGYLPYTVTANAPINDIAFDQAAGVAYLGGSFSVVGGGSHFYLAAMNVGTGSVLPGGLSVDGAIRTIGVLHFVPPEGGSIDGVVIGGLFNTVGGQPRQNLAALDTNLSLVLGWSPGCGGEVYALEADGGRIYAGGDFSIINGVPRSNLAAIDATAGALLDWSPTTDATVDALMVSGSTVYVGGQFSTVNATTRNRAASVNSLTGALNAFNPNVDVNFPTTVKTFAIDGSTVYMGGAFGTVRGVERGSLAAVNATTGALLPWNPDANGTVHALWFLPGSILGGPILVVGGQFTVVGGNFRNNLATLDAVTGASGPLDSPNGPVYSLFAVPTPIGGFDRIYVGGNFSSVGGQPRNNLAMIAAFGLVTAWDPNANAPVYSITLAGNTIYAGGNFTSVGAQPRSHIAAMDGSTGAVTAWDPNAVGGSPPGVVYSLLKRVTTVYAGGAFTTIAGTPQAYFAGISDGTVTGVDVVEPDPTPDVTPLALRVAPNPFEHSTMVQFSLASGGRTHVAVFDVGGRRIRELQNGWLPSGRHTIPWDGHDASGHPVAAGVYFFGVMTPAGQVGSKVYRLK